jgi:hypothetical protein
MLLMAEFCDLMLASDKLSWKHLLIELAQNGTPVST